MGSVDEREDEMARVRKAGPGRGSFNRGSRQAPRSARPTITVGVPRGPTRQPPNFGTAPPNTAYRGRPMAPLGQPMGPAMPVQGAPVGPVGPVGPGAGGPW